MVQGARLSRRITLLYAFSAGLLYLALAGSAHDAPLAALRSLQGASFGVHDAPRAIDAVHLQPPARVARVAATAAPPPVARTIAAPLPVAQTIAVQPPPTENRLLGGHGLDATVTTYSDCSGTTPLTRRAAAIDTCFTGQQHYLFFVGHNPGVFTPLIATNPGDVISYYDAGGVVHVIRIMAAQYMAYSDLIGTDLGLGPYDAVFQTCADRTNTVDRVLFGDWV